MQRKNISRSGLIIATALLVSSSILISHAQDLTPEPSDEEINALKISFPIPELGNCNNKEECKTYCEDTSHMTECIAFAESHGLMKKEEADRARQFKSKFESGAGGPGGCKSPKECEAFCRNIDNIEACVAFAEEHGVKDKHIEQGKKILGYIKSGGKMPGNCSSKESCEAYCGDFSHAEECFAFAKNAGVAQEGDFEDGQEGRGAPSAEHFKKLMELTKSGETPGGCKSKTECETYCHEESHREECIAFGEKLGFIKPEQAERFRKSGFKGPGSCNSEESCRNYCNDPAHQEECFRFAEEQGFVSKEEVERMKEGVVRFKNEVQNIPPEVVECVKASVGEEVFTKIQSGTIPTPELSEKMHQCFEKMRSSMESKGSMDGREGQYGEGRSEGQVMPSNNLQREVEECVKMKLGDSFKNAEQGSGPSSEMETVMRACYENLRNKSPFDPNSINREGKAPDYEGEMMRNGEMSEEQKMMQKEMQIRKGPRMLGAPQEDHSTEGIYRQGFGPTLKPQQFPNSMTGAEMEAYKQKMMNGREGEMKRYEGAPIPLGPNEGGGGMMNQINPQMMSPEEQKMYTQTYPEGQRIDGQGFFSQQTPPSGFEQNQAPMMPLITPSAQQGGVDAPMSEPAPQPQSNAGSTNMRGNLLEAIKLLLTGVAIR